MPNSSILVLPAMCAPSSTSRCTHVAVYGGVYPSRIWEPHVVGAPAYEMLSFTAIARPASRPGVRHRSKWEGEVAAHLKMALR